MATYAPLATNVAGYRSRKLISKYVIAVTKLESKKTNNGIIWAVLQISFNKHHVKMLTKTSDRSSLTHTRFFDMNNFRYISKYVCPQGSGVRIELGELSSFDTVIHYREINGAKRHSFKLHIPTTTYLRFDDSIYANIAQKSRLGKLIVPNSYATLCTGITYKHKKMSLRQIVEYFWSTEFNNDIDDWYTEISPNLTDLRALKHIEENGIPFVLTNHGFLGTHCRTYLVCATNRVINVMRKKDQLINERCKNST